MELGEYWERVLREAADYLEAGVIAAKPEPVVSCTFCEDRGWFDPVDVTGLPFPVGHAYHAVLLPCRNPDCAAGAIARQRYRAARLAKSELDTRYRDMTFDSWWHTVSNKRGKYTAFYVVKHYAQAWRTQHRITLRGAWDDMCLRLRLDKPYTGDDIERNWMVLYGPVGTTKTGLTAAFLNAVLTDGGDAVWHKFDTLIRRARAAIDSDGSDTMDSVLQAYAVTPMLILDEFKGETMIANNRDAGTMPPSDFERRCAELIINTRYNAGLPLLVTTNSDFDGIVRMWGHLIADRLKTAHWIPVMGENERPTPPELEAI